MDCCPFPEAQNGKNAIEINKLPNGAEKTCEDCAKKSLPSFFSKMALYKRLPFTKWAPTYSSSYLLRDLIAGITVGMTAIPQGIAYATVAGLEPQVIEIRNDYFKNCCKNSIRK